MGGVFVSGATGFIGTRLVNHLQNTLGADVVSVLSRHQHPVLETVLCDLQKEHVPDDALLRISTVYNLAGYAHDLGDASSVAHLYQAVNVDATVRLANLAVESGVKSFVFVSSVKAGGCGEDDVVTRPVGVYGKTKREAEFKLLEIGRQSGMHVSIVRPSLVYGAGAKGNLALMRKGIQQGWFPPLPETENRRSMIHVDDLVQVLLLVAEDERANGEIFIATDGVPHSSRKIYEAICLGVGKKVPKWSVPKFLFNALASTSLRLRYKVDKLLGDEEYSSEKLEALGFRAERTLKDWNVS
jgi:UDP-glucose 4-epimerase